MPPDPTAPPSPSAPGFTPSGSPWTEARLGELGVDEHDFQEFKGSAWLWEGGAVISWFHAALSKQISAFANGAGGRLFIGLDDLGHIDGGVPVRVKPGGTRSWLEDVLASVVSPALARFNVFEVVPDGPRSAIRPDHAVYVIEVPSSADAPHQAIDHRYYLRIGGKSRPMNHLHVQDVLRRTRHPRVEMQRIGPYGDATIDTSDTRGPRAELAFRAFVENRGRTLARHVGLELILPRQLVGRAVRQRNLAEPGVHLSQSPGRITLFRYHPTPLFPRQELYLQTCWVGLHRANADWVRSGEARLQWRVFADDADPVDGELRLIDVGAVRKALDRVAARPKA